MDDTQFRPRRRDLSNRLTTLLATLFAELGSWRDADADRFVQQAVPAVAAAQETLAQLTAMYVAGQAAEAFGVDVAPPPLDTSAFTGLRAGVTADEVYQRPFATVYRALGQGKSLDEAVRLGGVRLAQIAELDMQQAYARASQGAMSSLPAHARPQFWARILTGPGDCALCVVASTQRYRVGDLNPIHPHCDCLCKPLSARTDPGQVIAPQLLEQVHDAVQDMTGATDRGARAPDYRKLLTRMIGRHGEVGDMLHRPGDRFTGPQDLH